VDSGSYLVFATPQTIDLLTSREMTDQYGQTGPHQIRRTILLASKIDASLLVEKSAKRPRFGLPGEDGRAILQVGANKLKIAMP